MNKEILQEDVQAFIRMSDDVDIHRLLLSNKVFEKVSQKDLAQQIQGRKIAKKKFPLLLTKPIYYAPSVHLEQSSSQATARYKLSIIQQARSLIDITGGFGIDLLFIAIDLQKEKPLHKIVYCDVNQELTDVVQYNSKLFNIDMEAYPMDGITFIKQSADVFDVLLVDPSRRTERGKVILLEHSEPDLIANWSCIINKANQVIVKLSPMVDLDYVSQRLSNIAQIHVISAKNEVKEVLLVAYKDKEENIQHIVADIVGEKVSTYEARETLKKVNYVADLNNQAYLYEPFKVLLKANLQDEYAQQYALLKQHANTHLYYSNELIHAPLLKTFRIVSQFKTINKSVGKCLGKVNIVCRNFPLKPAEVLKKLRITQGGNQYLFCSKHGDESVYILTERV